LTRNSAVSEKLRTLHSVFLDGEIFSDTKYRAVSVQQLSFLFYNV